MKKRVLIVTSVALLFLVGCGQPAPDLIDNGMNNPNNIIPDESNITAETVDINENIYGTIGNNGNINGVNDTTNNKDNNRYTGDNSSSDNFRSIYFDFDRYNIRSNMESNVNHNGKVANAISSSLKIEGNCDEFGTDEYNYALGLRRAKTLKDRIISQGVDSRRVVMVSFGESNPVCREATDSCYDKNRRVDVRLAR